MPQSVYAKRRRSLRKTRQAHPIVRVSRWGNSLALRIPVSAVKRLKLNEGSAMSVQVSGDAIMLRPSTSEPTLAQLLDGVTPDMVGGEMDWGKPVGKEMW